jgi:hypothetical protein
MSSKRGLDPAVDQKSRVLILGSLPGDESLRSSATTAIQATSSGGSCLMSSERHQATATPSGLRSSRTKESRSGMFSEALNASEAATRKSPIRCQTTSAPCSRTSRGFDVSASTAPKPRTSGAVDRHGSPSIIEWVTRPIRTPIRAKASSVEEVPPPLGSEIQLEATDGSEQKPARREHPRPSSICTLGNGGVRQPRLLCARSGHSDSSRPSTLPDAKQN